MCYFVFGLQPMDTMKKLYFILILLGIVSSCDDGDVIVTSFDFDQASLQICGGPGGYVFYKINSSASESISLQLSTTDQLFLESSVIDFTLDGLSNFVNYRKYDGSITDSYFCNPIPPTQPVVINEYLGASGVATLTTTILLDDLDGLDEPVDSALDTDGDGLLNYFDIDDDGDNVPTAIELGNDPENPMDTDGDGILDYLDTDDDNDGVLTRYEAAGGLDPFTVVTDPSAGPDYLNPEIASEVIIDEYREHTYKLSSDIALLITDMVLTGGNEEIIQETLNMGEKQDVVILIVTIVPEYN